MSYFEAIEQNILIFSERIDCVFNSLDLLVMLRNIETIDLCHDCYCRDEMK